MKDYQKDCGEIGVYDQRNTLNELTGKQWQFSTKTVVPMSFLPNDNTTIQNKYPYHLPPLLAKQLIQTFTKNNETLLDPLVTSGAFLVGTSLSNDSLNQKSTNGRIIDSLFIDKEDSEIYLPMKQIANIIRQQSCTHDILSWIQNSHEHYDFICMELPLWNRMNEETSLLGLNRTDYMVDALKELQNWQNHLTTFFLLLKKLLKNKRYIACVLGIDEFEAHCIQNATLSYQNLSKWVLAAFKQAGFIHISEILWFEPKKDNDLIDLRKNILIYKKEEN